MLAIIKADNTNKYLCTDVCMFLTKHVTKLNETKRNENDKKIKKQNYIKIKFTQTDRILGGGGQGEGGGGGVGLGTQ